MTIGVINSTGKVGEELVRELHRAKADYRAATGSLERAKGVWDFEVPLTRFSYDEAETFVPALEGVTKLFLLHPVDVPIRHEQIFTFIDEAVKSGVKEIVFMSALGADLRPTDPLCLVEQYVAKSGAAYAILRPNWFMQNLNTQHLRQINERNEVMQPSGEARLTLIDTRDIAAVAAKLLLDGVENGKAYTLTGSEAVSYGEIAARLSALTGRTIRHVSPTPESEIQRMKDMKIDPEQVYFMEWLFEDMQRGYTEQVTSDVQDVLGRPPRTFDAYLQDYAPVWQVPSAK